MVNFRLFYLILLLVALFAFSLPWATISREETFLWSAIEEETWTGWHFLPYTFTYLIGLILELWLLISKRMPSHLLSSIAGALMVFGVLGGTTKMLFVSEEYFGATIDYTAGFFFALIWSLFYSTVTLVLYLRSHAK